MIKTRTIPDLRFAGFTGDWQEKKLGEVAEIVAGGDVDKSLLKTSGQFPVYANALTNDGLVGYYDHQYRISAPAVTVTGRGDVGFAIARKTSFTPVVRLLAIKSDHNVDFLANAINEHRVFVESTGVPQLTAPQLASYKISLPSLPEQEAIGNFFAKLDRLISLQEDKLATLKSQKKTYLSQLFPKLGAKQPQLRFAGFTDDWEEKKLGEVVERVSQTSRQTDLPCVEYEDIVAGQGRLNKDIFSKSLKKAGILFRPQDILFGKLRPYLQNWLLAEFTGIAVGDWWVLRPIEQDSTFVYTLIQSEQYQTVANLSTGTKMPRSDWKVVSETIFSLPSLPEQEAIGNFFAKLDHQLELEEAKLTQLKATKQTLLRQLFI